MDRVRGRSVVWAVFRNVDSKSVCCLLCRCHVLKKGRGSTTPMLRHLRVNHPTELSEISNGFGYETHPSNDHRDMEAEGEQFCSVEVALEDEESNTITAVNETEISSALNGLLDTSNGSPAEIIAHTEASDDRPVRRTRYRSVIWRHFEHLDSLNAARCRICMKKLVESGGISNLRRHLSTRHPKVYSELVSNRQHPSPSLNSSQDSNTNAEIDEAFWGTEQSQVPVEVVLKDSDTITPVNDADVSSAISSVLDASHGGPAERHTEANDDANHVGRRQCSGIWRHFERLGSLNAARCRICMKKLQCGKNGTNNLHQHMSKRHPKMLSELMSNGLRLPPLKSSKISGTNTTDQSFEATEQKQVPGALKVLRVSEGEKRVFKRERELIEALRRTQKEEARTLEHQRELLEKLRAASAKEAAAEKEQIESLRKAQQEEAKDLCRQREELQKEKAELQKKWEELQQQREEFLLFSKGQQAS